MPAAATHGHSRLWQSRDREGFRSRVTLTFDLLTSRSMHVERLPQSIRVPSLVLIAQAVFLLERGHTDIHTVTDVIDHPSPATRLSQIEQMKLEHNWLRRAKQQ